MHRPGLDAAAGSEEDQLRSPSFASSPPAAKPVEGALWLVESGRGRAGDLAQLAEVGNAVGVDVEFVSPWRQNREQRSHHRHKTGAVAFRGSRSWDRLRL